MQTLLYYLLPSCSEYRPERIVIANVRTVILYDCRINGDRQELLRQVIVSVYSNTLLSDFLLATVTH